VKGTPVFAHRPIWSSPTVKVRNINTWCSTYPEYLKVRKGMTLAQVRAIFGERGTLDSDGTLRWYSFTDCGTGMVDEFGVGFEGDRVASSFKWYDIR
jgi:hypothetical protein